MVVCHCKLDEDQKNSTHKRTLIIKAGDIVFLKSRLKGARKLIFQYNGPWRILKRNETHVTLKELSEDKPKIHEANVNDVKLFNMEYKLPLRRQDKLIATKPVDANLEESDDSE